MPSVDPDVVSRMTFAMAHGVAIEQLLDETTPADLFGGMLRLFFTGLAIDAANATQPST